MSVEFGKKYKSAFDRDGFVLIRGFFSPAEVRELNQRFERYMRDIVPTMPANNAFYEEKGRPETLKYASCLEQFDPYFGELMNSDRFRGLSEGLLGDDVVSKHVEWFNKCSRIGKETPPHQDGYYYRIDPNEGTHFWMALDPVDEGNGCIRYVVGSHRKGLREHQRSTATLGFSQKLADYGPEDEALAEPMIMQPGDLLVHHTLTIHRADPNTSDRERRAMAMVYYAARAKPDLRSIEEYNKKLMAELAAEGKI
jgi:phytanoyl-CoA hydroxylase